MRVSCSEGDRQQEHEGIHRWHRRSPGRLQRFAFSFFGQNRGPKKRLHMVGAISPPVDTYAGQLAVGATPRP
jgi:hypothetical protein